MIGSDNLNRRSWTHDSELSCAVIDAETRRPRADRSGRRGRRGPVFARDLRLKLLAEHLDRRPGDVDDLIDPGQGVRHHQGQRPQAAGLARRRPHGPTPTGPAGAPRPGEAAPPAPAVGGAAVPGRLRPRRPGPEGSFHRATLTGGGWLTTGAAALSSGLPPAGLGEAVDPEGDEPHRGRPEQPGTGRVVPQRPQGAVQAGRLRRLVVGGGLYRRTLRPGRRPRREPWCRTRRAPPPPSGGT